MSALVNDVALPASVGMPVFERYAIPRPVEQDGTGDLTRRLGDGDEAAWRHFHASYAPRLFRYLLVVTRGDDEASREALQQTFLRAVRHMRRFEAEPAFWSWLTVLARTALLDELRRRSRRASLIERWCAQFSPAAPSAPQTENPDDRLQELMTAGLEDLSAEDRMLLEQKYLAGESVREIAAAEHRTEKAIEARLGRARQKLRTLVMARLRNEDPD
jgi:RNA polymerase sigma-70 factor (ECF subfamily)